MDKIAEVDVCLQVEADKAGYGLVLALQVTVPCTRLTLVQSLSAEYPDHPRQMFRLELSDIQTAVALEDGEQDIRSAAPPCCSTCSLLFLCDREDVKSRPELHFFKRRQIFDCCPANASNLEQQPCHSFCAVVCCCLPWKVGVAVCVACS